MPNKLIKTLLIGIISPNGSLNRLPSLVLGGLFFKNCLRLFLGLKNAIKIFCFCESQDINWTLAIGL